MIVDFPIKNGDFPGQNVSSPEGNRSDTGCFVNQQSQKVPGPSPTRCPVLSINPLDQCNTKHQGNKVYNMATWFRKWMNVHVSNI